MHEFADLQIDLLIGHNFISYDYPVLERLFPGVLDPRSVCDTLVLSRLLKYRPDDGQGQGLEAWGARFQSPKHPSPDFSQFTIEMLEYCKQDVEINHQLYLYLRSHMDNKDVWALPIDVEMSMAWICLDMHENGFRYDSRAGQELQSNLEDRLKDLDASILESFKPKLVPVREITPKLTKHGTISKANLPRDWTDLTQLHAGCPFTLVREVSFNPGSTKQIVERLNESGWSPVERTKSGESWKINEVNLATLPEDAPTGARKLVERLLVASRVRTLIEWEQAYSQSTGRIHGSINPIGTWTGRCSHRYPNLGNIAAPKSIKYKGKDLAELATSLGSSMRSLWHCSDDHWLVGTDAEGIQLRIFAHYIDDKDFTEAVVYGRKDNGTDPHSLNGALLQVSRDTAKTFIYAFLLGAGSGKLAEILGCNKSKGAESQQRFINAYPGLKLLKGTSIPRDAARGFFEGFDGRLVPCNDEHLMLAGYLQNGEAVIMKHANVLWRKQLHEEGISFKQVNFIHDEWQTEVEGSRDVAEYVGRVQASSIASVARSLGLRCPMAGASRIGKTWLDTH